MTRDIPIVLVLARYDFPEEARADLAKAGEFFVDKAVNFYDAALLTTGAWAQLEIQEWATRLPASAPDPIRRARAGMLGDPVAARRLPEPILEEAGGGFRWRDLEAVGLTMRQDSAALVVAAQTEAPEAFAACFSRATRIGRQEIAAA